VSADFVSGATMAAALVIALMFFRYWRQSRDRLFLMFSLGFLVFGLSRLILAFLDEDDEGRVYVYGLRLLAFLLILAAIIDKNRVRTAPAVAASGNGRVERVRSGAGRVP
jgi:drug/metabolite transporter superfamily protein YnfA